ncbi:MAG: metallophosphoesterase [Clostridiales bacterium]|nr:metallophosphoesterase [Clostridiales bacterium]
MKRKWLCTVLAALMTFGFAACGEEELANSSSHGASDSTPSASVPDTPDPPENPGEDEPIEYGDFVPVLRFVVCSDIHLEKSIPARAERFEKFMQSAYAYSDSHEQYKSLDAIVVTGDLTDNPVKDTTAYSSFVQTVETNKREETTILTMTGNHETYGASDDTLCHTQGVVDYQEQIHGEVDRHITIKGFHFIALSTMPDVTQDRDTGVYLNSQVEWLETQLEEAEAADSKKPIFTFQHYKLPNTTYSSYDAFSVGQTQKLYDVYKNYSQVINFSGHTHSVSNQPRSIWQGEFTALEAAPLKNVGVASVDKFVTQANAFRNSNDLDAIKTDAATYYRIVEVDEYNRTRIYTCNLETNELAKTAATTDSPDEIMMFEITDPTDPSTFRYTDKRAEVAAKPYFEDGAQLQFVLEGSVTRPTAVFPQMMDDSCPFMYKIIVTPTDNPNNNAAAIKKEYNYLDVFYWGDTTADEAFVLSALKANTEYSVKVIPINIWGLEGEPLVATYSTFAA